MSDTARPCIFLKLHLAEVVLRKWYLLWSGGPVSFSYFDSREISQRRLCGLIFVLTAHGRPGAISVFGRTYVILALRVVLHYAGFGPRHSCAALVILAPRSSHLLPHHLCVCDSSLRVWLCVEKVVMSTYETATTPSMELFVESIHTSSPS